jgi:hypothetical protein
MTLVEDFRKEILVILEHTSKEHKRGNGVFLSLSRKSRSISLSDKIVSNYSMARKIIISVIRSDMS